MTGERAENILAAAALLRDGGIVVHATETVYGIAARWDDAEALARVAQIKGRNLRQPFSVMFAEVSAVKSVLGWWDERLAALFSMLFPAPVTLIVPNRNPERLPYWQQFGDTGIRMPDHAVSRRLIEQAGCPLITTSANCAGEPPPVSLAEITPNILNQADAVLDSGPCLLKVPSSIYRIVADPPSWQEIRAGAFPSAQFTAHFQHAFGSPGEI